MDSRISYVWILICSRFGATSAALLEKAKFNQSPCTFTPENRQFGFWIGDWNVVTTKDSSPASIRD